MKSSSSKLGSVAKCRALSQSALSCGRLYHRSKIPGLGSTSAAGIAELKSWGLFLLVLDSRKRGRKLPTNTGPLIEFRQQLLESAIGKLYQNAATKFSP
jgi:hypothetical protein